MDDKERHVIVMYLCMGALFVAGTATGATIVVLTNHAGRTIGMLSFGVNDFSWLIACVRITFHHRVPCGRLYWPTFGMLVISSALFTSFRWLQLGVSVLCIILFIIDWWRNRPPRNRKRKRLLSCLPKWRPLAWGVPARRPAPA